MKLTEIIPSAAPVDVASAALARSGATAVARERMNAMAVNLLDSDVSKGGALPGTPGTSRTID